MKASMFYPSRWLKSEDLRGVQPVVVIDHIETGEFGGENKPVVFFRGKEKGLVCNRTNWRMLASLFGEETDGWRGKDVRLTAMLVTVQGLSKMAVRILPNQQKTALAQLQPKPLNEPENGGESAPEEDDIPF